MELDGITYQLTQTVTDRAQSTYQNVLTINQSLADIIGPITFTCSVENTVGTSPSSQPLTIIGEKHLSEPACEGQKFAVYITAKTLGLFSTKLDCLMLKAHIPYKVTPRKVTCLAT